MYSKPTVCRVVFNIYNQKSLVVAIAVSRYLEQFLAHEEPSHQDYQIRVSISQDHQQTKIMLAKGM